MTVGVKIAAGVTLMAVLCVFLAPTIDLPDTVKVAPVSLAALVVTSCLWTPIPSEHEPFVPPAGIEAASDLLTRNHTLRI